MVVTLTGTDSGTGSAALLVETLRRCDAVIAFHGGQWPEAEVVPPGVRMLDGRSRRATFGWDAGEMVFFRPTGIRPAMDPTFAFAPLARLRNEGRGLRLVVAGPSGDREPLRRLLNACDRARRADGTAAGCATEAAGLWPGRP